MACQFSWTPCKSDQQSEYRDLLRLYRSAILVPRFFENSFFVVQMSSWSQQFSRNRTCHRFGHRCHKFVTNSKEIPNVLRSTGRRRSNPIDRPQYRPATGAPSKRCFDEETDDVTDSVTSHRFCHKLWQPVTCDICYKSVTMCDQICDNLWPNLWHVRFLEKLLTSWWHLNHKKWVFEKS